MAEATKSVFTDKLARTWDSISVLLGAAILRVYFNELIPIVRVARKRELTRTEIASKVSRAKSRILDNELGDLSTVISNVAGAMSADWNLDEAELIDMVWANIAHQMSSRKSINIDEFLTDKDKRKGIIVNVCREMRRDLFRMNKRHMAELEAHELLVNGYDPERVIRVESSGANPAGSPVYVDGKGHGFRPIGKGSNVRETFYARDPNPSDIDEWGNNRRSNIPQWEQRVTAYFGPNRVEDSYRVIDLLNMVQASYQYKSRRHRVSEFNHGTVRWNPTKGEKGTLLNVRDTLNIPATISHITIRNEAQKWAYIALGRTVDSMGIRVSHPSKKGVYIPKTHYAKAESLFQRNGLNVMDNYLWTPANRSDKVVRYACFERISYVRSVLSKPINAKEAYRIVMEFPEKDLYTDSEIEHMVTVLPSTPATKDWANRWTVGALYDDSKARVLAFRPEPYATNKGHRIPPVWPVNPDNIVADRVNTRPVGWHNPLNGIVQSSPVSGYTPTVGDPDWLEYATDWEADKGEYSGANVPGYGHKDPTQTVGLDNNAQVVFAEFLANAKRIGLENMIRNGADPTDIINKLLGN